MVKASKTEKYWGKSFFSDRLLDQGVPVEVLRWRAAQTYGGQKRVLKPEAERRPMLRRWQMTIADVYLPDQPQGAGLLERYESESD